MSFGWFLLVSLAQWVGGNVSTFDLGLFAQVAQSWAAGGPPHSTIRNLDMFGEHFSPVLAVTAVVWRVWPDPRVLLVVQAGVLAAAAGVMVHFGQRRLHRTSLAVLMVLLLFGYGVLAALTFDFHEVAFAPLFVALMATGLADRRLRWVLIGAVGLVLVKEDLGFTVLAAAGVWWMRNRGLGRRPLVEALLVAGVGVLGLAVAYTTIFLVGPDFGSVYGSRLHGATGSDWVTTLPRRLLPTAALLVATLGYGLRSPIALLAVPTLAWRALSDTSSYWTISYHYDLVLWAVAVMAVAHRLPARLDTPARRLGVGALSAVNVVMGFTRFAGDAPPWAVLHPSPTVAVVHRLAAAHIKPGESVAAQDYLGSYLIPSYRVTALDVASHQPVHYVFLLDTNGGGGPTRAPLCTRHQLIRHADQAGWTTWSDGPVHLIELPAPAAPPMIRC